MSCWHQDRPLPSACHCHLAQRLPKRGCQPLGPGAGAPLPPTFRLYTGGLAAWRGPCSPAPLEALAVAWAPAPHARWGQGTLPRCHSTF